MSIGMDAQCYLCHFKRNMETARALGDEAQATEFARGLMALYLSMPEDASSPAVAPGTNALFQKIYGVEADRFRQEKEHSNRFVLARMDEIRRRTESAADPVYAGLQMAILGNYIDFSALQGEVSFEKLDTMLEKAMEMELDRRVYADLCAELSKGTRLLYLTDNAGEIGFDRIFAEQLHKAFPHLIITFCVRGGPAQNDATREDAVAVGIPFPVIDNGSTVPGTELSLLSAEAKAAMDAADVILSKGQGNAETLLGCGYNIYYAFLIKCARFIDRYQKPKLTPMLVKEREACDK
ncbi:MAG: DUF89 family protein [Oscillospiraceae bacterium]|nr:DUF89 family protein [Oscillospiraceae bacterium]